MSEKYEFIDAEYATGTAPTVTNMCAWLSVSRSGFYEWRTRPESVTAARRDYLKALIDKAFRDSDGTYGYRRVWAQLARWGVHAGLGTSRSEGLMNIMDEALSAIADQVIAVTQTLRAHVEVDRTLREVDVRAEAQGRADIAVTVARDDLIELDIGQGCHLELADRDLALLQGEALDWVRSVLAGRVSETVGYHHGFPLVM